MKQIKQVVVSSSAPSENNVWIDSRGKGSLKIKKAGVWQQIGGQSAQSDWNQNDSSKDDYIKNKPKFKTINSQSITGTGNISTVRVLAANYVETLYTPGTYDFGDDEVLTAEQIDALCRGDYDEVAFLEDTELRFKVLYTEYDAMDMYPISCIIFGGNRHIYKVICVFDEESSEVVGYETVDIGSEFVLTNDNKQMLLDQIIYRKTTGEEGKDHGIDVTNVCVNYNGYYGKMALTYYSEDSEMGVRHFYTYSLFCANKEDTDTLIAITIHFEVEVEDVSVIDSDISGFTTIHLKNAS